MLNVHTKEMGSAAILQLQGQIVIGETETLSNAVRSLPTVSGIILDLSQVNVIDARGLGVLLELRAQAEATGIQFELLNATKWVSKVLEVSRLDSVFKITSGVEVFPAVSRSWDASRAVLAPCA